MSNRPFTDFPIDPNTTSGTELAEILDRFQQSVDSMNLGNGRPSYLEAGGLWTKGRSGTIDLYLFDGTKDVLVAGTGTGDGGMAISEQPPSSPSVGDMWMRLPNNCVMIWNGDFWFQFPSSGGGSSSGGDLPAGLERGQTLKWNGTAWEPSDVLRIHPGGVEAVDVSGKLHLHPVGTDPNGADMSRGPYGAVMECDVYWNATDGWTGLKNDWNIAWIRPNDDNLNANRRNAFDVIADKFVVRLSPAPADDPWYDREIVFRAEEKSVSIGARDYRSKVFVHGDCYLGMSENFYGKILPTNPDDKPGTFFCGGQSMLGSYIEGEPLTPINQAEIDDPSLIRQRAFVQDAALDMAANPIYNTGNPDDPRWALLRSKMAVTVEWIEKNAIVDDGSGTVVSKTSTQLGDSNDDSHQLIGDVYVGYDTNDGLPDNSDAVGGTLFLHRGMIVGRNNSGNASIGMEGNVIFDLGDPISDSCAVSKKYVDSRQALQAEALEAAQRKIALSVKDAVAKSTKFAELKDNLIEAMGEFL